MLKIINFYKKEIGLFTYGMGNDKIYSSMCFKMRGM